MQYIFQRGVVSLPQSSAEEKEMSGKFQGWWLLQMLSPPSPVKGCPLAARLWQHLSDWQQKVK